MRLSEPFVSIIVPAFNAEDTLAEAVQSALAGAFTDFELIIVDDGSTDRTAEVARALAKRDGRIRVIERTNGGVSAACNSALALSQGKFVARLDADDIWHPRKLQLQVETAKQRPEAAFLYTGARYIDAGGRVVRDVEVPSFPERALCRGLYQSLVGINSSAMYRRDIAVAAGGYDEALAGWEDLVLQLRISERHKVACVPAPLVGYRIRPGSLSSQTYDVERSWRNAKRSIEALFPQVPKFVHSWAHGRRCAAFAENYVWRGDMTGASRLLREAFRHDPEWTARWLGYRAVRRLKKRTGKNRNRERPLFLDAGLDETIALEDLDSIRGTSALHRLEARRYARLAEIDRSLARSADA